MVDGVAGGQLAELGDFFYLWSSDGGPGNCDRTYARPGRNPHLYTPWQCHSSPPPPPPPRPHEEEHHEQSRKERWREEGFRKSFQVPGPISNGPETIVRPEGDRSSELLPGGCGSHDDSVFGINSTSASTTPPQTVASPCFARASSSRDQHGDGRLQIPDSRFSRDSRLQIGSNDRTRQQQPWSPIRMRFALEALARNSSREQRTRCRCRCSVSMARKMASTFLIGHRGWSTVDGQELRPSRTASSSVNLISIPNPCSSEEKLAIQRSSLALTQLRTPYGFARKCSAIDGQHLKIRKALQLPRLVQSQVMLQICDPIVQNASSMCSPTIPIATNDTLKKKEVAPLYNPTQSSLYSIQASHAFSHPHSTPPTCSVPACARTTCSLQCAVCSVPKTTNLWFS